MSRYVNDLIDDQQLRWKEDQQRQKILWKEKLVPLRLVNSLQRYLGLGLKDLDQNEVPPKLRMGVPREPKMVPPGIKNV